MTEQDALFQKRMLEMATRAQTQCRPIYTRFLNLMEQDLFLRLGARLSGAQYAMEGGAPHCERKLVCLYPDTFSDDMLCFPIAVLRLCPRAPKFAEALSHRDFLGALLHLGIDRSLIGDIFPDQNKGAVFFCEESVADFLCTELTRVRHTEVACKREQAFPEDCVPAYRTQTISVPSVRLDAVLAAVWKLSRADSQALLAARKVFVNARQTEKGSVGLAEGDVVSVRGYGRFVYRGESGASKKGRLYILVETPA